MPEARRFRVMETRELFVSAVSPAEAISKASENLKAHDCAQVTDDDINMRVTDMSASED